MKHQIYLEGEFHSEHEVRPGDILGEEQCRCEESGEQCHVEAIYDLAWREFNYTTQVMSYHYALRCAHPIVGTLQ